MLVLNDIAWPTRLLVAGFGVAVGVMIGGPALGDGGGVSTALLLAGLGVELVVIAAFPLVLGRGERAFREVVVAATAQIASGEVVPVPAIGRVVRRRVVPLGWFLPGRGGGPGPAALTVLTVIGDGPARRVAALVPVDLGLVSSKVPAALLVHPHERDVAVLEDRITAARLAEIGTDPRWGTERLPTDRTVVGGYVALAVALGLGVAAGLGVSAAVVTLAT